LTPAMKVESVLNMSLPFMCRCSHRIVSVVHELDLATIGVAIKKFIERRS
jgi:hypothetical protein